MLPKKQRRSFVRPDHPNLSLARQCQILGISRSGHYYQSKPETDKNLELMKRIDEIYTKFPFYGVPKITGQLNREGNQINHKRIERLMNIMGISAIVPKKNLSKNDKQHLKYPYLLKNLVTTKPNHVWGTDITYIRANGKWFYLTAIMDWYSRYVISWKLSPSLKSDFCLDCLKQALKLAKPDIHNSDQGVQFTDKEYIAILQAEPTIKISMDGRGRCFDNIFTERLWRNVKYEEVYLNDYESFEHAKQSLNDYFHKYNYQRIHEGLNYQTPAEIYFGQKNQNQQKNEVSGWLLSDESLARRYLMPKSPKDFIANNQIIQLNPKVEKITLSC